MIRPYYLGRIYSADLSYPDKMKKKLILDKKNDED